MGLLPTTSGPSDSSAPRRPFQEGTGSDEFPLAVHWDGTEWSAATLPDLPDPVNGPDARLNAVRMFSGDDVWAVGAATPPDDLDRPETLVMYYNGSSWSVIPSPVADPRGGGSEFHSIDGVSSEDLWAVGHMNQSFFASHWNGSEWEETFPPPGTFEEQILRSVSVISSDDVWVAGHTGIIVGVEAHKRLDIARYRR